MTATHCPLRRNRFGPSPGSRGTAALAGALTAIVLGAGPVAAQVPDSVRADTTRADTVPRYAIEGFSVMVPRAVSTTGGSSAIEVRLDSMAHVPAPTLEQVLREMPLVQIRQNSRGEAQPALRGAEDRQIAVLVDGVPLTLGWDHRTDLSIIPLTAAQSIKLIRGLSSVLHGPNVLGGVVEVDVARGSERQAPPEPLTLSASIDHLGGRALGATGGRLVETAGGEWVVRAGAGHQDRPGYALAEGLVEDEGQIERFVTDDGDLRLNSDVERWDGFLSARYRADTGTWLSFSGSALTTERGVPPEAHVEDPRLWRYPEERRFVGAFTAGTGQRATAWGQGDLEMSLGVDVGKTVIDAYDSPEYQEVTGGEVGDDRTLTLRLLGDHSLGSRGELRGALTFADVDHDELLDGTDEAFYSQRLWSLASEVELRFDELAGLAGTGTTRLSLGMALDGADTPETGGKPDLGRIWDWGGRVGMSTLVAGGDVMLHGALSRRARFPALRELYSGALGRFLPNPDLRAEVLTGGELGFTVTGGAGEVQAVGFHQRLTDGIVRTTVEVDGDRKFQRINQDEVRSTGLEVLARAAVGRVRLNGDVTLQRVRGYGDDGEEVRLEYEPTVTGKVGVATLLPWELVARGDVRYMSEQHCQNPEIGGLDPFETDPAVDASLRRTFRVGSGGGLERLEAVVALDNVGDAAVFDQCGLPQPGRTLRLQIRLW